MSIYLTCLAHNVVEHSITCSITETHLLPVHLSSISSVCSHLVYDVVKLLLHFLVHLLDVGRGHREASNLFIKLLQQETLFFILILGSTSLLFLPQCLSFGFILCFLKGKSNNHIEI